MICILLGYLGYRRFFHRPKRKSREAPPTGATCSSRASPPARPAPLTSRSWATNMEDKYYATMRERDDIDDYGGSLYNFAPQRYGQQQPPTRYGPQQPRYDNRQRYNGGPFVDPVEQLRLLLQAVPVANAPAQPAIVYQAANQLAPVHQVPPPPPPNVLNLGAAANNANAAAAAAAANANAAANP
jgi:hypothetical protein